MTCVVVARRNAKKDDCDVTRAPLAQPEPSVDSAAVVIVEKEGSDEDDKKGKDK